MSAFRNVFLGLIAVTALSAPALTQSPRPSPNAPYGPPKTSDGITLYYPKTGRTVSGRSSCQADRRMSSRTWRRVKCLMARQ
jgi:hypothetical protein